MTEPEVSGEITQMEFDDKSFCDLGADYYNRFNKEKKINSYVKQLSKLGVSISDDAIRVALEETA